MTNAPTTVIDKTFKLSDSELKMLIMWSPGNHLCIPHNKEMREPHEYTQKHVWGEQIYKEG